MCPPTNNTLYLNSGRDESESTGVNFKEFVRTLACFRPIQKKEENLLNDRQHKLQCKLNFCNVSCNTMISRNRACFALFGTKPA